MGRHKEGVVAGVVEPDISQLERKGAPTATRDPALLGIVWGGPNLCFKTRGNSSPRVGKASQGWGPRCRTLPSPAHKALLHQPQLDP